MRDVSSSLLTGTSTARLSARTAAFHARTRGSDRLVMKAKASGAGSNACTVEFGNAAAHRAANSPRCAPASTNVHAPSGEYAQERISNTLVSVSRMEGNLASSGRGGLGRTIRLRPARQALVARALP